MEHIIARQNAAAKPATGKTFLLGVAQILLELAIAQVIVNLLIRATGVGLLNLLFYAFAVVLLIRFMTRTVAGTIYTLRTETLVLQRLMGDSTVLGVEIPLDAIVSIRPYACGQRLHLDYRQVTYVDVTCAPGARMRAAFALSLVWAWLARVIAGRKAHQEAGCVVVYMEGKKRIACAFKPDEAFAAALKETCPDVFGADERLAREPLLSYAAKSLRRTFGALYPHVPDAVTGEELAFEQEEFARRRQQKIENDAKKKNIPLEEYVKQLDETAKKKAAAKRKRSRFFASLSRSLSFLAPVKALFARVAALLAIREPEEEAQEAPQEESKQEKGEDAPRRRRSRQE